MHFLDVFEDRVVLLALCHVDFVVGIDALSRAIGGDGEHLEFVDLFELVCLSHRRARHAGELGVHAEVVLQCDRRVGLRLALDGDTLFRFDRLVQAVGEASAGLRAPCVLVDDDDLVFCNDVIDIALHEEMGAEELS